MAVAFGSLEAVRSKFGGAVILIGLLTQGPMGVRGRSDGLGADEWVNDEDSKVRCLYDKLGIE